ncbi:hypothetical protein HOG27_03265 [bacterium]|nr:hypothetical protein [bacterium]
MQVRIMSFESKIAIGIFVTIFFALIGFSLLSGIAINYYCNLTTIATVIKISIGIAACGTMFMFMVFGHRENFSNLVTFTRFLRC